MRLPRFLLPAVVLCAALAPDRASAQAPTQPAPRPVSVFLDCGMGCDSDFIHTEVSYVDWVRDRADADVHLLVTSQSTAGGGSQYTLAFLGRRRFEGRGDTLTVVTAQAATPDDIRRAITRTIQLGLVPFLARTDIASRLSLRVDPQQSAQAAAADSCVFVGMSAGAI